MTPYDYCYVTRMLCTYRRVGTSTEPTGFSRMCVIDGSVPGGVLLPPDTPQKLRASGVASGLRTLVRPFLASLVRINLSLRSR